METSMKFYENTGNFLGRNGFFKATGLNLLTTVDEKHVVIAPITSKGKVGRCEMWIPVESIEDLIRELYSILPDGVQEYFPITSVSRADLTGIFDDAAYTISSADMKILASKMANDYLNQLYWESLEILAIDYIDITGDRE
jgi:hypothetical protein